MGKFTLKVHLDMGFFAAHVVTERCSELAFLEFTFAHTMPEKLSSYAVVPVLLAAPVPAEL